MEVTSGSSTSITYSDCQALLELSTSLHGLQLNSLLANISKYLENCTGATLSTIWTAEKESSLAKVPEVFRNQIDQSGPVHLANLGTVELAHIQKYFDCDITSYLAVSVSHSSYLDHVPNGYHTEELAGTATSASSGRTGNHSAELVDRERSPKQPADKRLKQAKETAFLVCLGNKRGGESFTDLDIQLVQECFRVCGGILMNTLAYHEEERLKSQYQKLLTVAKNLFTHLDDVTVLLRQIMSEARKLTQAERCSLFLVDRKHQELVAKVFDGQKLPDGGIEQCPEMRMPITQGIAGHVATTGKLLNISDAYEHPQFYSGIDRNTGFKTRNILCFPIKDDSGVIGVAELCNKETAPNFTAHDEEMATAFSAYCGLAILHSLMYKKVADAQYRSKLSNELMMYHMKVPEDEVISLTNNLKARDSLQQAFPNFTSFEFSPRCVPIPETAKVVFTMFKDLEMIQRWRIPEDSLARFILMVKRGYRDPPYHNWMHAFSVAHFAYLLLKNVKFMQNNILSDLEGLALIVACLCHDVDHRGTNNSFQISSNSVLAALYSSEGSVMERHHFAQSMCILNTDGCNILENLSKQEYTKCLDLMRENILATDIAHHLRILGDLRNMAKCGYDANSETSHRLLSSLLMTASDLSDSTKNWNNSRQTAKLVYTEFFTQGDLEKAMGNKPQESMDREKAFIPQLQIQFLEEIALPVYRVLGELQPGAMEPFNAVKRNMSYWRRAGVILSSKTRPGDVMDIFKDDSINDIEIDEDDL